MFDLPAERAMTRPKETSLISYAENTRETELHNSKVTRVHDVGRAEARRGREGMRLFRTFGQVGLVALELHSHSLAAA